MAPSDIDFYKVLGLGREATNDDIKKSFRKLARELHPDKNMNDPLAKENFQQLQQAYDTLRDEFERSKYNGSNPYHGRAQAAPTPRSTTASRYASAPKPSTPSWATGSWGDGYTGGYPSASTRTKPKAPTARDFTEHFGTSARTRTSGYEYNNYKAPMDDDEFDDPYKTPGSYSYDPYASTTPRGESAYAKTSGRKASETPAPRPKSTTGTPYAAAQGAGFDLKAYVRQKQEQELAEKRSKEEADRRVWEAEEKVKEELRRAKEDQRRAKEDLRKEELRKEDEAAARRKREAKAFSAATGAYDDAGYTYTYGKPSSSSSRSQEDEANRRADEKMAGRKVKTPASKKSTKTKARTVTPDKYPSPFDVYDATPGGDADGEAEPAKKEYFSRTSTHGRHSVPNFDFSKPTEKQRAQKAHMEDRSSNEPEYSFKPSTKATPRRKSSKKPDDDTPVNPFKFQEPATPETSDASKTFTKNINLNFSAEARGPFSTFTANSSPSPPTNGFTAPPPKPASYSNLFPAPPYIPSASVPPSHASRPTLAKKASFQKDLYENLVKTAEPFAFQPTNTSPKKRSTFPPFRTKSRVNSTTTSVPAKPTVESASDSSGAPTPLNPADVGLGEPMDLAPDNGIPIPPPVPTFSAPAPRFVAPTDTLDLSSLTHHLPDTHTATLSLYPSLKPHIPITTTSPPPSPPKIPRIPEEISLNAYNRLFHTIGPYMAAWKLYEAEIQRRRELLLKEDIAAEGANMTKVMEGLSGYVNRVREYDVALDKTFEKAREKHLRGLEAWAELRRLVIAKGRRREAVDGAPSTGSPVPTEEKEEKRKGKETKRQDTNEKTRETRVKTEEADENIRVKVDDLVDELVV